MTRLIVATGIFIAAVVLGSADISLPKQDTFYDKVGRGFANIVLAPAEIADSFYTTLQNEGPTVAATKGVAQGLGRAGSDMALGVFDLGTSPLPIGPNYSYRSYKQPAHGSMVVDEYPPADLITNWY